jgi:hypothetical protein
MAYAALLSLEEFRDRHRRAEVQQRLCDRFDHCLDRVEAQVKEDPKPTLEELTQAVLALRQELTQAVTEAWWSKPIGHWWSSVRRSAPNLGNRCRREAQRSAP